MQLALGRANIVIECHRVKLVLVIWAARFLRREPGGWGGETQTECQAQSFIILSMFSFYDVV